MRIDNTTNMFTQQSNQNTQNTNLQTQNKLDSREELSDSLLFDFDDFENLDLTNDKILYNSEENLSSSEKFTKDILDNIIGQFFSNDQAISLFPQAIPDDIEEMFQNPYDAINTSDIQSGMMVGVHQEYYQRQTLDFNTSLTIQTPNSTYQMEISISITQELYISQDTLYNFDQEKTFDPMSLFYDKDENPFEGIDKLSFIFDKNQEEDTTLQEWIKEMLGLFDSNDEEKEQENSNNLINIYSETFEQKYELSSIIDTDQGKAVFLSSSEIYYNHQQISYQSSNTDTDNQETLELSV